MLNHNLLKREVQEYIEKHLKEDVSKMAFKGSPFEGIETRELITQISGKKKAEKKLPTWFAAEGIIYPPGLNLEQTSSEVTAAYKASLVSGKTLADLTGGFGVDTYFFAKNFSEVHYFELNEDLSEVVAHNLKQLGVKNVILHSGNSLELLESQKVHFDWLFLDPARRDESGGRVFKLADCLPDIPANLDLLFEHSENLLIKTSPLLDLQAGILELQGVKEIHIVAVENDVKELLWILKKNASEEVEIKTINFTKTGKQVFKCSFSQHPSEEKFSAPLTWLYEPNAAIMKSGLFSALGKEFNLFKLHPNTHLFTSEEKKDFPGRRFKIKEILPYKKKPVKAALPETKANVTTRNFPESVATIRKKLGIKDGGNNYLFFTTLESNEKVVLLCEKI